MMKRPADKRQINETDQWFAGMQSSKSWNSSNRFNLTNFKIWKTTFR